MNTLLHDIQYAVRMLRKSPGFTLIAVLTLALGIGANTAIFSVVNTVLLRPLPVRNPEQVMVLLQVRANGEPNIFSTPAYLEWKDQSNLFEPVAAVSSTDMSLTGIDQPERVHGGTTTANFFSVMQVNPALGRTFTADEDLPGGGHVIVLSYGLWQRLGGDPNVLGKTLTLDGNSYTVIGVMPRGFQIFDATETFWMPLQMDTSAAARQARNVHWLFAMTRLDAGMSQKQAQAQFDAIAARIHRQDPDNDAGWGVTLQPLGRWLTGDIRPALLILLGCVGFVLLIACANIANLLLARGAARRREIAVRIALGAGRLRLVRQLLTESLLLAAMGGALALFVADDGIRILVALHPASIPGVEKIGLDASVMAFTFGLAMVAGILFGVAPAIQALHVDSNAWLKEGARGSSGHFGKHRAALVVTQIGLALVLLTGAGLLLKSLWLLRGVNAGFNAEGVLTMRIVAPNAGAASSSVPQFYTRVLEKVRALPGVQSAAIARNLPMSGTDPSMPVTVEGHAPDAPSSQAILTRYRAVSPEYFHTLGTPLLSGRDFQDGDTADSEAVAIISESMAREYWPNESPIGERLLPSLPGSRWCTVVGVVGDVRHLGLDIDIEPTGYYPYTQIPAGYIPLVEGSMSLAVRSAEPATLTNSIREAIHSLNHDVPIYDVKPLAQLLEDSGSLRRFNLALLGIFAGLALTLAGIGIYGVVAYSVAQRTREIGIRLALGAQNRDVLRLVLGQGARLVFAGVALGVVAALALARVMASLLYGVTVTDPLTFICVAMAVIAAGLAACYVPARRAMRVDPMVALRYE
ncbi:MAG: ABC transporter permease [Candidatus Acidiferrales bacterium]